MLQFVGKRTVFPPFCAFFTAYRFELSKLALEGTKNVNDKDISFFSSLPSVNEITHGNFVGQQNE